MATHQPYLLIFKKTLPSDKHRKVYVNTPVHILMEIKK